MMDTSLPHSRGRDSYPIRILALPTLIYVCLSLFLFTTLVIVCQARSSPLQVMQLLQEKTPSEALDVDLQLELEVDRQDALPGDRLNYSLRYQNIGTETADSVFITINAPNRSAEAFFTTLVSFESTPTVVRQATLNSDGTLNHITVAVGSLPPAMQAARTIDFSLQIIPTLDESKALTTTAVIVARQFTPSEVSATTRVNLSSDLKVAKSVLTPPLYDTTDEIDFLIVVTNDGNKTEDNVLVYDLLPRNSKFIASVPAPDRIAESADGDTAFWTIGPIEREGGRDSVIVTLRFSQPGNYINTGGGFIDEIQLEEWSVAIQVVGFGGPEANNFTLTKSVVTPPPFVVADTVEYLIRVENNDNVTHDSLVVYDELPGGLEFIMAEPEPTRIVESRLVWEFDSLAANGGVEEIRVTVALAAAGELSNLAGGTVGVASLPTASTTVTISAPPNLTAEFTDCSGTVDAGANIHLAANIANIGDAAAGSVEVAFFVNDINSGPIAVQNLSSLAPQQSQEVTVDWANSEGGSHVFFVLADYQNRILESAAGLNFENDNIDSTLCPPPPDPEIQVTPETIEPGEAITIALKVCAPLQPGSKVVATLVDGRTIDIPIPPEFPTDCAFHELTQRFTDTRLRGRSSQEIISFELQTHDIYGNIRSASDNVTVLGSDACAVSENVYRPRLQTSLSMDFKLSSNRKATVKLWDISGRYIATVFEGDALAGSNAVAWAGSDKNGNTVGSGVYVLTVESGDFQCVRKFILVR